MAVKGYPKAFGLIMTYNARKQPFSSRDATCSNKRKMSATHKQCLKNMPHRKC